METYDNFIPDRNNGELSEEMKRLKKDILHLFVDKATMARLRLLASFNRVKVESLASQLFSKAIGDIARQELNKFLNETEMDRKPTLHFKD
jgi:hypothetical protein